MAKKTETKPHYHGHRERLRQRFDESGASALADYELLELILFRAIPRRDVKALAKTLIAVFGDFSAVLSAEPERLMEIPGISVSVAREIRIVRAAGLTMQLESLQNKPVITSWSALETYCRSLLAHEKREQFRVLFLDKKNRLIADEQQNQGTIDHTPVYPREVMRRALELGSSAVILVHNHPSGDPTPSTDDIDMTKRIITAGKALNIRIHDHIIVGRTMTTSFKALQLI